MLENDTICAISTPLGEGGIGIVRLSGPGAYNIAGSIFECSKSSNPGYPIPRCLYHGYIKDKQGAVLDEVLVSFMPAPYTYTRENIVEINCHSGIFALRAILKRVMDSGVRLAEPGEFTKRAFLHGRIDLSQAEAVMNIIRARSEEAVKVAARALQGDLAVQIEHIRDKIINIRAPIEAWFDYPEEFSDDLPSLDHIKVELDQLQQLLQALLKGVDRNRAYQEGVSVAIIGRPNVGKSSLLNALLRQQRAIVHELPGTTRDMLEGYMNLGGYPISLVDTAGIQGTADPVEKQGIERSRLAAERARLLIVVLDGSALWTKADSEIAALRRPGQGLVAVINKIDLEQKLSDDVVRNWHQEAEIVKTAALTGEGIQLLEDAVTRQLDQVLGTAGESPMLVSIRHEEIICETKKIIDNSINILEDYPVELISLELQTAWLKLGEITGDTVNETLLDKIFSEFCLGK